MQKSCSRVVILREDVKRSSKTRKEFYFHLDVAVKEFFSLKSNSEDENNVEVSRHITYNFIFMWK